ncbi:Target of rapamycin complex 1 subunit kog1, partial [Coemansia sp. RSA 552]
MADVAEVTLDPTRGSGGRPAVIATTATGTSIDMSELVEESYQTGLASKRHVGQTLMEGRVDFHTHPRSLALAHLQLAEWRTHDKLRTVGALLVVCLNIGTDPPDLVRPLKRSVLEAWIDPNLKVTVPTPEELAVQQAAAAAANGGGAAQASRSSTRERTPMKMIGENLLRQFEHIQRHAKYKLLLDCAMEDLRKYCMQYRRMAKDERLMFHYNGHGVPRPTPSGDIWVFNKQFTQYIPVSAMDLMGWIGTPCVYVWDCSNAMNIVSAFEKNAKARDADIERIRHIAEAAGAKLPMGKAGSETIARVSASIATLLGSQAPGALQGQQQGAGQQQQQQASGHGGAPINSALINLALLPPTHHEDIHFAATQATELLPTNPEMPADLFTSCLTTPVRTAVRFWVVRNPHLTKVTLDMCDELPGSVQDRRTPLGELNWIFTSISDTIAWSTLPRDLFRKLFRQDVVVASLYRNFILADRIMRFYGVHPQCSPAIPQTHKHPLWESLDLEIDMCLQQLPRLLKEEEQRKHREERAKLSEQERLVKANRRGKHKGAGILQGINPMGFVFSPKVSLEIAGTFKQPRHRARVVRESRAYDSDDANADGSGNDSDGVVTDGGGLGARNSVTGYVSSTYFSNQLYAFEVWLQHAATVVSQFVSDHGPDQIPRSLSTEPPPSLDPPDELPAVLQVLLSQQYRLRALILLYRFMNLGPWAVDLAMAVGIYPYMSKLLATTTTEIREILILVWARLIAVDRALHPELLKEDGMEYFVLYLANNIQMQYEPPNEKVRLCDTVSAASAFTLTLLCKDMPVAQQACFDERVLDYFLVYLQRPDNGTDERACLRTWILMCLAELWKGFPNAKWMAITYRLCVIASKKQQSAQDAAAQGEATSAAASGTAESFEELLASSANDESVDARDAQDLLIQMAFHRSPVVRAAAIYAMGTLLEDPVQLGEDPAVLSIVRKAERQVYALLLQAAEDGSPMVRCEVARVIGSAVFASYMPQAVEAVARTVAEEIREHRRPQLSTETMDAHPEVAMDMLVRLYKALLRLSTDAHPDVSQPAREACDVLMQCYAHSRAFISAETSLDQALRRLEISRAANGQQPILDVVRTPGSSIGDALLGNPPPTPQSRQQRTRPATRAVSRSSALLAGGRGQSDVFSRQQLNGSAQNRHTMYVAPGNEPRQSLFGEARSPPTPRSPSAAGSISIASLHIIETPAQQQDPYSGAASPSAAAGPQDRLSGLGEGERAEAMRRMAEIEQQWQDWGRRELRESICASTLLDWAGAHFTEFDISLFANVSGPLQGSAALVESRERNRRVDRMEASARLMSSQASVMKWTDVRSIGTIRDQASTAILHPLEPHAIVATNRGTVSVFDWEMKAQVGHYSIGPRGRYAEASNIGSLHLINPLGQAKLLVGTRDGKVRIFASHAPDFDPAQSPANFPSPRLLTAFTALSWASRGPAPGPMQPTATTVAQNQRLKAQRQGLPSQMAGDLTGSVRAGSDGSRLASEGCGL